MSEQDKCREALRQLEQAATGVFNAGAQTGHQWPKLAVALVNARSALASIPCVNAEAEGWQPIETAPKGSAVLVNFVSYGGRRRTTIATYYEAGTLENDEIESGYAEAGWYEEVWSIELLPALDGEPLLWMPLPAAPRDPREAK